MARIAIWDVIPPLEGTYLLHECHLRVSLYARFDFKDEDYVLQRSDQLCRAHLDEEKVEITVGGCTQMRDVDMMVDAAASTMGKKVSLNAELLELPSGRIGVVRNWSYAYGGIYLELIVVRGRVINSLAESLEAVAKDYTGIGGRLDSVSVIFFDDADRSRGKSVISVEWGDPQYAGLLGACLRASTEKLAVVLRRGLRIRVGYNATQEDIEDTAYILDYLSAHVKQG